MATAVDPLFKNLRFLNEEEVSGVKAEIVKRMDELCNESNDEEGSVNITTEADPAAKKRKTALDFVLGDEDQVDALALSTKDEFEMYFSGKTASRKTNPLTWWKENSHRYPHLAKVARSILNIPSTSTPAERSFSKAGQTVTKLRSSLKPSTVDCLIFLNKNMKFL